MPMTDILIPFDTSPARPWLFLFAAVFGFSMLRGILLIPAAWAVRFVTEKRTYKLCGARGQFSRELFATLRIFLFDAAYFATVLKIDVVPIDEKNAFPTFLFAYAWMEVWTYAQHRAMHTKKLWFIHRHHHESAVTGPLTSFSFSVAERALNLAGFSLGLYGLSLFTPLSHTGIAAYLTLYFVISVFWHGNVELVPPFLLRTPFFFWITTPTHHALHHARVRGNYGTLTRVMDRVFNTEFADYPAAHRRAYAGEGFTALNGIAADYFMDEKTLHAHVARFMAGDTSVYKLPRVRERIDLELRSFCPGLGDRLLLWLDPHDPTWYLRRGFSVSGPYTLSQLRERAPELNGKDECFSLKCRLRLRISALTLRRRRMHPHARAV